jgi:regulator of sigma E protease
MFGEQDFSGDGEPPSLTPEDRRESFQEKPLYQRAAVVAAGPVANFLFAIALLFGVFATVGLPGPLAVVGGVQPGSAAAEAGFAVGDRILRIDGEPVRWFDDVRGIVSVNPGTALRFDVERNEAEIVLTAVPRSATETTKDGAPRQVGLLGIKPDPTAVGFERQSLAAAFGSAIDRTVGLTAQILTALGEMITGSRTGEELGGPIRIAQLSGQMAQDGSLSLLFFMAALSVNLGLINLLPIPMLDGGHLAFYTVEALRGKPLNKRTIEYGFRFGLLFVAALMIFATWNDLSNLKVFEFLRKLVG